MNREERRWARAKPLRQGAVFRAIRVSAGLKFRDVCSRLKMDKSQLSDIERGIKPLPLRRAKQLAAVLDAPVTEIVQAVLQDHLEAEGVEAVVVTVEEEPKR